MYLYTFHLTFISLHMEMGSNYKVWCMWRSKVEVRRLNKLFVDTLHRKSLKLRTCACMKLFIFLFLFFTFSVIIFLSFKLSLSVKVLLESKRLYQILKFVVKIINYFFIVIQIIIREKLIVTSWYFNWMFYN